MKVSKAVFVAVLAGINASTSVHAEQAEVVTPTITRLTNNSDNEFDPKISGSNVIWTSYDDKGDQLFFSDGKTTTQLSENGIYRDELKVHAEISGSRVVWLGYNYDNFDERLNDTEIFFYDGKTTRQLTNNSDNEFDPQISGSKVVWFGSDGNDGEIFLYDGKTTRQLTNNNLGDYNPQISGSKVVWSSFDGNDNEIFLYDGKTTRQLTNNDLDDSDPQISGSYVVWKGGKRVPCNCYYNFIFEYQVFLYNGKTTTQLTNNSLRESYDHRLQISGSKVVWYGSTTNNSDDNEIFFYDGRTTTQLTNNNFNDSSPQISGSYVVWNSIDPNNGWETLLYDGRTTTQLTTNTFFMRFGDISGLNVVWTGYPSATPDFNKDQEIFLGTLSRHHPRPRTRFNR